MGEKRREEGRETAKGCEGGDEIPRESDGENSF